MNKSEIKPGDRFNKLTVLEFSHVYNRKRYFKCLCDCGNNTVARGTHLKNGQCKSCGCLVKQNGNNRKDTFKGQDVLVNHLFNKYKSAARERDYDFNLTFEQFKDLIFKNCHYCGTEPGNLKNHPKGKHESIKYNGIDRVDNAKGYDIDNVVSCCKMCNIAKGTLTVVDFENWILRLAKNLKTKSQ